MAALEHPKLYYEDKLYRPATFRWNGSGYELSSGSEIEQRLSVIPTLVWGTGLNIRISGVTLFGEVKLPIYSTQMNAMRFGPQAPLTLVSDSRIRVSRVTI